MYAIAAADIFGGGFYNFDLKSECVNGKYAYVYVRAWGAGVGAGVKFNPTGGA